MNLEISQHLVNLVSWKDSFSASHYYDVCLPVIRNISMRGKIPIIVGGTSFYITWILHGKPSAPQATQEIIQRVHDMTNGKTWHESLTLLKDYDPIYASTLQENDYYRLHRALGIVLMTGQPLSNFVPGANVDCNGIERDINQEFDFRCFYLTNDRFYLSKFIDKRCEEMIQKGLIREVLELKRSGLSTQYSAGRAIGYQQTLSFLDTLEEILNNPRNESFEKIIDQCFLSFLDDFQSASRQYSRRQDVWFKSHSLFNWCHWELFNSDKDLIAKFISEMFNLEACDFYSNETLKITSRNSLDKRFNPLMEKKMRTFHSNLVIYHDSETRKELLTKVVETIKNSK